MQYLRSRQPNKSGGRARVRDSSNMVPSELAEVVEQNPNHYFSLWLNSARDWAKEQFKEKQKQQWSEEMAQDKEWLWGWEIDETFSKKAAPR